jgi:hypothetical protein
MFIFCAMAGGKHAPEGKSEMKIRIICKYEGRQSLSAIAHELGFAISTVNTIFKDAACIIEHVKGTPMMK